MTDSDLQLLIENGVTVVALGDEYANLDESTLKATSARLLEIALTAVPPLVVVDMTRTRFFGSTFLGTLFLMWQRVTARNGKFAMCGVQGLSAEILTTAQADRLWELYDSRDAAVNSLTR